MISVITINYNNYAGLEKTLQSLSEQEFEHKFQHIIIDGGSTDGSQSLLRDYTAHNSNVFVRSEKDRGIYDAMNKGLSVAEHNFIGFLNSGDTLFSQDTLSILMEVISKYPHIDLIYGDLNFLDSKGQLKRVWKSKGFKRWRLLFGWCPPHPMTIVKKCILKDLLGFDERLSIAADYDLLVSVLLMKDIKVHYIDQTTVNMELGGQSNASVVQYLKSNAQVMKSWYKRVGIFLPIWIFITKPLFKVEQFFPRKKCEQLKR